MTTIGDLPQPKTKGEYLFVIFELTIGLIMFATVLGYIANIVINISAARKDFQGKSMIGKVILHTGVRSRSFTWKDQDQQEDLDLLHDLDHFGDLFEMILIFDL